MIHRADRLADILALLGDKAGSFAVRPVHPYADEPAKRVLVHAVKTGKAPLRLLPPLVLHDRAGGKHSAEAEAILRGEARSEVVTTSRSSRHRSGLSLGCCMRSAHPPQGQT